MASPTSTWPTTMGPNPAQPSAIPAGSSRGISTTTARSWSSRPRPDTPCGPVRTGISGRASISCQAWTKAWNVSVWTTSTSSIITAPTPTPPWRRPWGPWPRPYQAGRRSMWASPTTTAPPCDRRARYWTNSMSPSSSTRTGTPYSTGPSSTTGSGRPRKSWARASSLSVPWPRAS